MHFFGVLESPTTPTQSIVFTLSFHIHHFRETNGFGNFLR